MANFSTRRITNRCVFRVLRGFPLTSGPSVSYTILSVKQEKILEELDDEAKIHIIRGPRTGANSWRRGAVLAQGGGAEQANVWLPWTPE